MKPMTSGIEGSQRSMSPPSKQVMQALAAQRHTGYRGEKIPTHRALLRLDFPYRRWADVLLIPLLVSLSLYLAWPWISEFWRNLITFWATNLHENIILRSGNGLIPAFPSIPYPYVNAAIPTLTQWYSGMVVTLALLFGPGLLSSKMLPVAYTLRLIGLVQASAQVYFYLWPASFHYAAGNAIATLSQASLLIIAITPWLYAFIYNIFDFGFARKLLLSLLAVAYLIILQPLQYILTGVLLLHFSLLWYPLIYLLGSTLLQIAALVALYAWAMSWQRMH